MSTDVATSSAGTASMGGRGRRAVNACREEFTLVVENGKAKMQCNHCRLTITNHTATLRNHLARKHSSDVKVDIAPREPKAAALATLVAPAPAVEVPVNDDNLAPAVQAALAVAAATTATRHRDSERASTSAGRQDALNDDVAARKEPKRRAPSDRDTAVVAKAPASASDGSSESKKRRLGDHDVQTNGSTHSSDAEVVGVAPPLIDRDEFAEMNREMHEHDEKREQIIKRSREILKSSKQAIYALHRNDRPGATALLAKAETVIPELLELTDASPSLRDGALSAALEEYVEAKAFSFYLTHHRLVPLRELPHVQKSEYIGGVIDFTGELMRYAVVKATARDVAEVERCRAMVEAISGEFIQFDFRNGPLRKKFDAIKYNLRKLENTLYELSLITNSGLTIQSSAVHDDATDAVAQDL